MQRLLVIDDEPSIQHAFRRAFGGDDLVVESASSAAEGIEKVETDRPDAVILDVHLPDCSGLDAFGRIRAICPHVPVIFITGHATTETAILATQQGAFDYIFKPIDLDHLKKVVGRALSMNRMRSRPVRLACEEDGADADDGELILGRCSEMQDVYKSIGRVSAQDVPVLISGETGTGKELVARAVFQHSRRVDAPFLTINCAALPENLIEAELFGYERGAFTGADRRRIGKFEQCDGGTLFLDEIGEMSPAAQAKVLRVLDSKSFTRVGGDSVIRADVRLITATNRDLETMVAEDAFRLDLLHRLNVFRIHLPPLRDRGNDLREIANFFLRGLNAHMRTSVDTLSDDVWTIFEEYSWPGNVRELQAVLKQAVLKCPSVQLTTDDLPESLRISPSVNGNAPGFVEPRPWQEFLRRQMTNSNGQLYQRWQEMTDGYLLEFVMQSVDGNLSQAARILGINRRTLREKLKASGLRNNTLKATSH